MKSNIFLAKTATYQIRCWIPSEENNTLKGIIKHETFFSGAKPGILGVSYIYIYVQEEWSKHDDGAPLFSECTFTSHQYSLQSLDTFIPLSPVFPNWN